MKSFISLLLAAVFVLCVILPASTYAQNRIPNPGPKDTCPVCGMFVALYPDWTAKVTDDKGRTHYFDGAKDMFKFILNPGKYKPGLARENLTAFQVTDYYTLKGMDAQKAFYVIGSDVPGPMGHELIPLQTKADALEFMVDHKGVKMFTFDEVTLELLKKLDSGIFE